MRNQLQFVTYEQSKKLKELGFDWEVASFYFRDGKFYKKGLSELKGFKGWKGWYYWEATKNSRYSAPTVALALKWFRDVKKAIPQIYRNSDNNVWLVFDGVHYNTIGSFDTYEAAESALLDELLKISDEK